VFGLTTLRRRLTGLIFCGALVLRRRTLAKRIVFAATLLTFSTLMFQAGSDGVGNVGDKTAAPVASPQRRNDVIPPQIIPSLATPETMPELLGDTPSSQGVRGETEEEAIGAVGAYGGDKGQYTFDAPDGDRPFPSPSTLPYVTAPNSIEGIICDRFGDGCDYWIAVALCESSMHPDAIGYGGAYVGLFQVWLGHGYGYDWLLDPWNNALAAWKLSREGTVTSPWPYCQWVP
jgi:hypothetical protein